MSNIKQIREKLGESDTGEALAKWKEATDRIKELNDSIVPEEAKSAEISKALTEAQQQYNLAKEEQHACNLKIQSHQGNVDRYDSDVKLIEDKINSLENKETGVECSSCFGEIKGENIQPVIKGEREKIKNINGVQKSCKRNYRIFLNSSNFKQSNKCLKQFSI